MRKLHSLISLLLVLLVLTPCALADAPLLQAASDWNLADTPLSVTLSISLQAHAPFDETRTAMLDRLRRCRWICMQRTAKAAFPC